MAFGKLLCRRYLLPSGIAICAALLAFPAQGATTGIGTTSLVVAHVDGITERLKRRLALRDDVFRNEIVQTGIRSASELHFADDSRVTVGPRSRVVLDEFVYDPDPGEGTLALRVTEGVFRFFSGNMASSNYSVATPSVTVGIRGTIIAGAIDPASGAFGLILESAGSRATVTSGNGATAVLNAPGLAVVVGSDGSVVSGPAPTWLLTMIERMDGVIARANISAPPRGPGRRTDLAAADSQPEPEVQAAQESEPDPEPEPEPEPEPVAPDDKERGLPRAVSNHDPDNLPYGLEQAAIGGDAKADDHATDPDGGPGAGNDKDKGKGNANGSGNGKGNGNNGGNGNGRGRN